MKPMKLKTIDRRFAGSKKRFRKMIDELKLLNEWIKWYNAHLRGW